MDESCTPSQRPHTRKAEPYDDSPWTREELHSLAWEAGENVGWEEMDEYDELPHTTIAERS